ncbi:major facilitator superfamily transporter [Schizothecium vesticola]|uniref:Major facilitator superfamily transporter n=1 Tax=Schizothecium vesticola TaxID=314040 RepID=A0AA40EQP3_9PEZI|nr:major facilitator superfamily transporter [Schizothecium vesticola]
MDNTLTSTMREKSSSSSVEPSEDTIVESAEDAQPTPPTLPLARYLILAAAISLGFFLALLDTSIVATSLYAIAIEFQEVDNINWVALSYTLAYLSCAVLFARISDVIGRKVAYLTAYAIFVAFSLACGWSKSLTQLIVFRALQGIGGSGLYSLSMILLPEVSSLKSQQYVGLLVGATLAMSGVMGPLLGGALTEYANWRWVFWINGPLGAASAGAFFLAWPDKKYLRPMKRRTWGEVDFLGSFLLVAAACLIVFPFQNSSSKTGQWSDPVFIAPLVVGVACAIALLVWQAVVERKWPHDMAAAFPMVLLRNRIYALAVVNSLLLGFVYLLAIFVFPIRFQVVNNKTPFQAGLMLLPMLGATALASYLGGAINSKRNWIPETLAAAGILMLLGCALEMTAGAGEALEPKVLGFLAFLGFGFGLSATCTTLTAIMEAPLQESAPAHGIIAQMRILGGSLGIAASSAILGVKMKDHVTATLSSEQRDQLGDVGSAAIYQAAEKQAIRDAYTAALRTDMAVCCGVLAAATLCAVAMYKKTGQRVSLVEMQKRQREAAARMQQAGR